MRPHPFFLIQAMSIFMMMLVPLSSMAQETESNDSSSHVYSKQDNFGGWRLGGDILFGTGRCDDKGCIGHPEDDFDQKNYSLSVMLQFEAGYFWGENVFFGPVVDVSIGMPMFTNVDIRYKIIFPFTERDAISFSLGVGMEIVTLYGGTINVQGNVYFPIQIGYEHVMDSGFVIGATVQANPVYGTGLTEWSDVQDEAWLGMFSAGLHLGYQFR